MKILNDPNVLLLCQQFDLERPEIVTLHVSKYTYDETGIKINEVKKKEKELFYSCHNCYK